MQAAELVGRALAAYGTKKVFGVLGDGNMLFAASFEQLGIAYVAARREDGAITMADGYARTTGQRAVASVSYGPALTNGLTALTEAVRARSPLVVITGEVARSDTSNVQRLDQRELVQAVGARYVSVGDASQIPALLGHACAEVEVDRVPIVVAVPFDVQLQEVGFPTTLSLPESVKPARPHPDIAVIEEAAAILVKSRRVLVLAGGGAIDGPAEAALARLADRAGALLCTTLRARGLFHAHPFCIGVAGGYTTSFTRRLFKEADCVLSFGASLNRFTTQNGSLFPNAIVVRCDVDEGAFSTARNSDVLIRGDAQLTAEAIADALGSDAPPASFRTSLQASAIADHRHGEPFQDMSGPRGVDLRSALTILDAELPDERIVVVDTGHFTSDVCSYVSVSRPRDFVFSVNFGSVGLALGNAIGAAIGSPGLPVVAFVGDGGLMMSVLELDTAVRAHVPLMVVVCNDGGFGAEIHKYRMRGLPWEVATYENPDFAEVARSLGAEGHSVLTLDDLRGIDLDMATRDKPILLDIHVDPVRMSDWYERIQRPKIVLEGQSPI
jgi:thiamine pyrophosphate-dependent acetolactate synthase large subunit-like protein